MRLLLVIIFVVVPLAELALIIQVQGAIGLDLTLLALVAISIVGAVLVKREGVKAWRRVWEAFGEGRAPAAEVVDGALLLVAGALLLTPGFMTDAVGFFLLIPATRGVANRGLRKRALSFMGLGGRGRSREAGDGSTIDVEVVDVRRDAADDPPPPELGRGGETGSG